MSEQVKKIKEEPIEQEGTATHSGWMQFYSAYSKYRDECIRLGKNVLGNDINLSIVSLSEYHSALYSMAQQVFSFYTESTEEELTNLWLDLGEKVEDFLSKIRDRDFRNQMNIEGQTTIDRELKVALLKYFNKVDRMAAEAGLQVGKENKGDIEPKKGLIGFGTK
ncbi:MAG: hypothetical protein M0R17_09395 [Candidatus Omnitrophica bacterium]|jgi:hypothetical protein|nr:hypothetical protein [Candidatus Omnitrophota bacterium]